MNQVYLYQEVGVLTLGEILRKPHDSKKFRHSERLFAQSSFTDTAPGILRAGSLSRLTFDI